MPDDNIKKLKETLLELQKGLITKSTVWVTAEEVNWGEKTMIAKGVDDGLEYYDVLLGIGNEYKKPKQGTKCLIGQLEGYEAAMFLISASEVEEAVITVGDAVLKMKPSGFEIMVGDENLGKTLGDLLKACKALTVPTGVGPSGTPINIADFIKVETSLNSILI